MWSREDFGPDHPPEIGTSSATDLMPDLRTMEGTIAVSQGNDFRSVFQVSGPVCSVLNLATTRPHLTARPYSRLLLIA
jgi:hypothetical protein